MGITKSGCSSVTGDGGETATESSGLHWYKQHPHKIEQLMTSMHMNTVNTMVAVSGHADVCGDVVGEMVVEVQFMASTQHANQPPHILP